MSDIAFYYPTKAAPTFTWIPQRQPAWPYGAPRRRIQIRRLTAGGTRYVQNKGVVINPFNLVFQYLEEGDKDLVDQLYQQTTDGLNTLQYKDKFGELHTVRFVNSFNFIQDETGLWSGNVEMEKVA